jgi:hypothetical protein
MDVLENKTPGPASGLGSPVATPVAGGPAGNPPGNPPIVTAAAESVPLFGGKRGGKARKDGLAPGSPEALAADKKRDRDRKKAIRDASARVAEPPALPSAAPGVAGDAQAPAGVLAAGPGGEITPPPVPWQPELLTGLIDELVEAAEENRVGQYLAKCEEAGLTGKLVKEIEGDARFPKAAKVILKTSLPRLACKWLNKSGLSAEWQDEVAVITALILIVQSGHKTNGRLDELIEMKRAEEKKRDADAQADKDKPGMTTGAVSELLKSK